MSAAERVRALIEPLLATDGIELVDVDLVRTTLRISVDRPGGIDLDGVAAATQRVSDRLDEVAGTPDDPTPGTSYTLEVSSPGLERPLRTPAHYRRFVGTTVSVKTKPGVEGERRIQGALDEADDEGFVVAGRRLSYDDVERARTVFEWGPAPKPGKPARKKAKT